MAEEPQQIKVEVWAPRLSVVIGGQEFAVASSGTGEIIDCSVTQSLKEIDSFTLTLYNWDEERLRPRYAAQDLGQLLGTSPSNAFPFSLGQSVEIKMGYPGWEKRLIQAEVTRIKPNYPGNGPPTLTIEGSDGLHKLKGGTQTKAFFHKTDSEMVEEVVRLANQDMARSRSGRQLRVEAERTTVRHDHVFLVNQTYAAFLKERARRIGYEVMVRDDTLYFRPPAEDESRDQLKLVWGETLSSIEINLNLNSQVTEVEVRAWDGSRGQRIAYTTTEADLRALVGHSLSGAEAREQVFGGQPLRITNIPVRNRDEARELAISRLRESLEEFVTLSASSFGLPDLLPGNPVEIDKVDPVFAGDYYLTKCTHRFGSDGYRTQFEARRMSLHEPPRQSS